MQPTILSEEKLTTLLPYALHQSGQSGSGTDFTSGLHLQPQSEELKKLLEKPLLSFRTIEENTHQSEKTQAEHLSKHQQERGLLNFYYLTQKSDEDLFDILEKWLHRGIVNDLSSELISSRIIKHLRLGEGKDFTDTDYLVSLMLKQPHCSAFINELSKTFRELMQKHHGDFTQITSLECKKSPRFSWWDNSSLATLVGGTQELKVWLVNMEYNHSTQKYQASLNVQIYDDFGINESDITNATFPASIALEGMVAQWILNNQRAYKPFRTRFDVDVTVEGSLQLS